MKGTQNKGKGILKKTAALALAVMTFATSFSCDYAAVGAFAAEVSKDAAQASGNAVKSMTARVGATKKKATATKKTTASSTKKKATAKAPIRRSPTRQDEGAELSESDRTVITGKWKVVFDDDENYGSPIKVKSTNQNGVSATYIGYIYDGDTETPVKPAVTVYYNDSELTKGKNKDYIVEYGNNNTYSRGNGGLTGTVTINPTSNWQSSYKDVGCKISFYIQRSITTVDGAVKLYPSDNENDLHNVTFKNMNGQAEGSFQYNGSPVKPVVKVVKSYDADHIAQWEDITSANITVKYFNNEGATTKAKVEAQIPSDSIYAGETISIQYTITASPLQSDWFTVADGGTYNGIAHTPNVTVSGATLTQGTDYSIEYKNNTDAGDNASVVITGKGNYSGTVTKNFTISRKQAVDSSGKLDSSEFTMEALSGVYRGGDPVEPVPQITYSPKDSSGKQMTLKAGTDFDVTYTNNTAIRESTDSDAPTAHIVFKGNYKGEFDAEFSITNARLNSDGATVSLDGKTATVSNKNNSDDTSTVGSDDTFSTDYDPIDSEVPQFVVKVGNKTLDPETDYTAYTIDNNSKTPKLNIKPTSGEHEWPSVTDNSWKWELTLTGQDNYSGAIKVQFSVDKLKLSDNSILLESATIGDDGNANVTLQYTSKQNSDKKTIIKAKENNITNFDIKVDTGKKAQKDATITLTGKGNYTGTKSVKASKGYDLSDENVTSTDYGSQIMILLFNPYTGELINGTQDRAHAMVYYGANVRPKVVLLRRIDGKNNVTSSGSGGNTTPEYTYRQLTEGTDYSVSAPTRVEGSYSSETNTWRYTIDVSADSDSSVLYNSKSKPRTITYYVGPLDLSKHTEPNKNTTNTGDLVSITPDNSALTSYSNINTILGQVKLYVKPSNVGQEVISVLSGDYARAKLEGTTDNKKITWTAPNYWTSAANQQGEELKGTTDFTLNSLNTDKKTVVATGVNNYYGSYTIHLDQVDIGSSTDFEISPFTADNPWNGDPVFPEVGLHQKSTDSQIAGTNYYVIYKDKSGHQYVLSTYANNNNPSGPVSQITDNFTISKGADSVVTATTNAADTITKDSTQIDPIDGTTVNKASYFIGADKNYSVTIRMKTGNENTTKLTGQIGPQKYAVSRQSVNDKINWEFTTKSITYKGFKDGEALTPLPQLTAYDESVKEPGTKLEITSAEDGSPLSNSNYKLNPNMGKNKYFAYPGVKEVAITGIGKYAGTSTATYTVTGNLGRLYDNDYFTFRVGDYTFDSNRRLTVYTTDSGTFRTAKDQDIDLNDVHISIPEVGIDLQEGTDYTISTKQITGSGSVDITITGKGVYTGSSTIKLNVVESRANLQWASNNSDTLELPYRQDGYRLGESELAIFSQYSGKNISLTQISGTDESTGDRVSITGTSSDNSNLDPRQDSNEVKPTLTKVGTYTITISGPPAANQTSTLTLSIKYNLSTATVDGIGGPYPYTGSDPYTDDTGFRNAISVTVDGKKLTVGSDYTISRAQVRGSYANAGSHDITIDPTSYSKYWSDPRPSYAYVVNPLNIDQNMHAADLTTNLTYNGAEQSIPDSDFVGKVTYDGINAPLVKGTDYDVSYPDGIKDVSSRSDYKLRYLVTGKGNYAGAATYGYFIIKPYNLKDSGKITIPNQYYGGAGVDVIPQTISLNEFTTPLEIDTDYTAVGTGRNSSISTGSDKAKVRITGKGNFTGTVDEEYIIQKLRIEDANVNITNLDYTGDYFTNPNDYVSVTIPVNGGKQLTYDKDYTLRIVRTADGEGNPVNQEIKPVGKLIDAGDYDVIVEAKSGSELVQGTEHTKADLHIEPKDISGDASDFSVSNAEWTGNPVKPDVYRGSTKVDSSWLKYTGDITDACGTLEEMRAVNSGFEESNLPTVTVTGHGNFKGSVPLHFTIGHSFSGATVSVNGGRIIYNGDSHNNLSFTISHPNRNVDTSKVKYEVKYPDDMVNAGDKSVVLTAINGGPLYGTKTVRVTIYPISGSTWTAEFTGLQMDSSGMYYAQYQGAPITPEVKAYVLTTAGQRTEIPLQPSEITYANNNAAGTASVTIKPQNYEGTKVLYFKINGVDISQDNNVYVAFSDGITRRKYTGSAIQPAVTVTFAGNKGTVVLTKDRDYSLTYTNNTKAGAANVKITGIGNYSGSRDLPFNIWADLNDRTSTFTIPKQMYNGEPITTLQGATLKAGGNDLAAGTDYTLSITSTDAYRTKGTAIFTAQGPYYEGTRTVQFDIGNDASMYNVIGVASSYVFDHQAHKPVPVVTDKQGQVYETNSVVYSNTSDGDACINAGNVRMTISITSHGQTVSIPYNYTIESKNINTATFTPLSDVNYNGKAHRPSVRITEGTRLLTGTSTSNDGSADYVVSYFNNTLPGKAQVVVTGINNYTGTANLYFDINVKAAPQMIVTAMPSGRLKVTWKKVSGVSGYRVFYTPTNGTQRQVNVSGSKKSTYLTGLTRGVVYTVGVQSYITANGVNGYSSASVQQIATSTSKPTITSAKSTGKGRIKITWKKVSNATAYMVYRKTSGSSKWARVKTTKSTSYTNTGLKSGTRYTYKVISYKQSGVKRSFSKYSNGRTVRAK